MLRDWLIYTVISRLILALLRPLIASEFEKKRNGIDSLACRENNYERKVFITGN